MRPRRRATELLACLLGVVLVLVVPGGGAAANPIVSTPTSGPQQARTSTTLRIGSEGYAVKVVQLKLASYGFSLKADGVFGPITEHRVKLWQEMNGLVPDGTVGTVTLDSLGLSGAHLTPSEPAVRKARPQPVAGCYAGLLEAYGMPTDFFVPVMKRESGCDPTAYNGRGDDQSYGLLQLNTKGTLWGEIQWRCGVTSREQLFDPETNIACAAKLYSAYGKRPWAT